MNTPKILMIALAALSIACSSIEGTRDLSRSTLPAAAPADQVSVIVLSDAAQAPALKEALVSALSAKGVRAGKLQTLEVRELDVVRQRVGAVDTGRSGWVNDSNNVWLVRVQFQASLKDMRSGRVLWSGVGEAEDVHSPRKQDFGLVVVQKRAEDHTKEAIDAAAEGVARELAP